MSKAGRTTRQRPLAPKVVLAFAAVVLVFIFGEALIRLLASPTPSGPTFLNTLLLPRDWNDLRARNRDLLKQISGSTSYLIADDLLGWTVGSNRGTDLYFSSHEGIRSATLDMRYAARQPRYRIASIGDSFTFAEEVPFEASWPNRLEQQLGSNIQVLNFGVSAYGVDQAYLRYLRDVRPWRPNAVVLGFIEADLYRNLRVYNFDPKWTWPFAKPRLIVDAGALRPLNVPVPSAQEILSTQVITDLPFLGHDPGFEPMEWTWRPYYYSYLVRFILSRLHRSRMSSEDVSKQAIALGVEIIASFARIAKDEGSTPLVVYFPTRRDFRESRPEKISVLGFLRERGIPYEDLTPCLSKLGVSALFTKGLHYSPEGNARVARCLAPVLRNYTVAGNDSSRAREQSKASR